MKIDGARAKARQNPNCSYCEPWKYKTQVAMSEATSAQANIAPKRYLKRSYL
jgi:hypothetical protein